MTSPARPAPAPAGNHIELLPYTGNAPLPVAGDALRHSSESPAIAVNTNNSTIPNDEDELGRLNRTCLLLKSKLPKLRIQLPRPNIRLPTFRIQLNEIRRWIVTTVIAICALTVAGYSYKAAKASWDIAAWTAYNKDYKSTICPAELARNITNERCIEALHMPTPPPPTLFRRSGIDPLTGWSREPLWRSFNNLTILTSEYNDKMFAFMESQKIEPTLYYQGIYDERSLNFTVCFDPEEHLSEHESRFYYIRLFLRVLWKALYTWLFGPEEHLSEHRSLVYCFQLFLRALWKVSSTVLLLQLVSVLLFALIQMVVAALAPAWLYRRFLASSEDLREQD